MQQRPSIKVCGLTRVEDIELALSLGADYCGLIVYPKSPRGLTVARATELSASVPAGKRVVVDVATDLKKLEQLRAAGFDYFQIHYGEESDVATLAAWSAIVGKDRLWLAPRVAPGAPFPETALQYADTILVDTYAKQQVGGTGQVGDWDRFTQLRTDYPHTDWILAGGLSPANLHAALKQTGATHLDFNSGVESAPGLKDPTKLREVFQSLRS